MNFQEKAQRMPDPPGGHDPEDPPEDPDDDDND